MGGTRRWFRVSLAIMLIISLLTACMGGGNETVTEKPKPDAKSDAKTDGPKPQEKPLEIKMLAALYSEAADMNDAYWSEWQKKTNTKLDIEWIPSGDFNTKMNLVLSSGTLPEVLAAPDARIPTLLSAIKNGAFWDLTPFLGNLDNYPNLKTKLVKDALKYLTVEGKIYALPRSRSRMDNGIKIRTDWLEKLNISIPKTLDEYEAALKKIVDNDPDGNGKKDTIGLLSTGIPSGQFAAAFGALDPQYNPEGGMIESRLTPQYTSMLEWFRKLYEQGILAKEFSAIKNTEAIEMFTTGKAASYMRSIWWDYEWEKALNKVQPGAKLINLPPLKGPGGVAVELNTGVSGGFYISKKVPEAKVKQILKYLDLTTSDELHDFAYYGTAGIHHKVVDGQKQLTDQGVKEVNVTSKGAGVLQYDKWGKVMSVSAPKAYNDNKMKEVGSYDEVGKINPFVYIVSDTWLQIWPKYEKEFESMATKAVVGQISMDEYKKYVDKLNNLPEMKKAYTEFADSYKKFHGK